MLAHSRITATPAGNPRDSWPAWTERSRWTITPDPEDLAELPVLADPGDPNVLYQGLNHRVVASELPGGGAGCEVQALWRGEWQPRLILEDLDHAIQAAIGGDDDPDPNLGPAYPPADDDDDSHHEIERVEAHGCRSLIRDSDYAAAL